MTLPKLFGMTLAIALLASMASAEPLGESLRALKALDLSAAKQLARAEPTRDNFNKLASTVAAVIEAVQTIPLDHVEMRLGSLHNSLHTNKIGAASAHSPVASTTDLSTVVASLQAQILGNITEVKNFVKARFAMTEAALRQNTTRPLTRSARMLHAGLWSETDHQYAALDWDLFVADLGTWLMKPDTGLLWLLQQRVVSLETNALLKTQVFTSNAMTDLNAAFQTAANKIYLQILDVFTSTAKTDLSSSFQAVVNKIFTKFTDIVLNGELTTFITTPGDIRWVRRSEMYTTTNTITPAFLSFLSQSFYTEPEIDAMLRNYLKISDSSNSQQKLITYTKTLAQSSAVLGGNGFEMTFELNNVFSVVPRAFVSMNTIVPFKTATPFSFIIASANLTHIIVNVQMQSMVNDVRAMYFVNLIAYG